MWSSLHDDGFRFLFERQLIEREKRKSEKIGFVKKKKHGKQNNLLKRAEYITKFYHKRAGKFIEGLRRGSIRIKITSWLPNSKSIVWWCQCWSAERNRWWKPATIVSAVGNASCPTLDSRRLESNPTCCCKPLETDHKTLAVVECIASSRRMFRWLKNRKMKSSPEAGWASHSRYDNCRPTGNVSSSGFDVRQYFVRPSGQHILGQQSWSDSQVFSSQNNSASGSFGHFRGIIPRMAAIKLWISPKMSLSPRLTLMFLFDQWLSHTAHTTFTAKLLATSIILARFQAVRVFCARRWKKCEFRCVWTFEKVIGILVSFVLSGGSFCGASCCGFPNG